MANTARFLPQGLPANRNGDAWDTPLRAMGYLGTLIKPDCYFLARMMQTFVFGILTAMAVAEVMAAPLMLNL